jgi:hypothetical protein
VANGTHASTKTTFGLKLHLVLTEKQKITQFEIKYSDRKKLHRKCSLPETAIGKFQFLFGFTLSKFRSQIPAFASFSLAIFAFNISSSFRHPRYNIIWEYSFKGNSGRPI